jgi:hypothetical protein
VTSNHSRRQSYSFASVQQTRTDQMTRQASPAVPE